MKLWQKLSVVGAISAASAIPSCAIQKNLEEIAARGPQRTSIRDLSNSYPSHGRSWGNRSRPRYSSGRQYQNRQTINRRESDRVNLNPDLWYMVPLALFALGAAVTMRYHESE